MVFVFCFIQVQSLTLSKNVLSAFLKLGTLVLDDIELTIVMSKFYHKVDFFPVNAFFMVLGFLFLSILLFYSVYVGLYQQHRSRFTPLQLVDFVLLFSATSQYFSYMHSGWLMIEIHIRHTNNFISYLFTSICRCQII